MKKIMIILGFLLTSGTSFAEDHSVQSIDYSAIKNFGIHALSVDVQDDIIRVAIGEAMLVHPDNKEASTHELNFIESNFGMEEANALVIEFPKQNCMSRNVSALPNFEGIKQNQLLTCWNPSAHNHLIIRSGLIVDHQLIKVSDQSVKSTQAFLSVESISRQTAFLNNDSFLQATLRATVPVVNSMGVKRSLVLKKEFLRKVHH